MNEENFFYDQAFDRNIGILTKEQQLLLKNGRVAIAGLGGSGGINAYAFARTGICNFNIADMDIFEVVNINRQAGAIKENIGNKKTEGIKNLILSINPYAKITSFEEGISEKNIDDFLCGVDVVVDALDFFQIEVRRLLFKKAKENGLYVITSGPIGFGATMLVFDPLGMDFDSYMNIKDSLSEEEKLLRFGLGITPSLLQRKYFKPESINWNKNNRRAPSLGIGTLLVANLVSTEVVKIITKQYNKIYSAPHSIHFDPYLRKLKKVWIPFGNKNPIQIIKLFIAKFFIKQAGKL